MSGDIQQQLEDAHNEIDALRDRVENGKWSASINVLVGIVTAYLLASEVVGCARFSLGQKWKHAEASLAAQAMSATPEAK